ncbi:MAG TPA: hypothetical protein PLQ20_01495 [Candidatus Paceibacterota bacterium]|nr:hypothetical protein [Candidatus Paceibacterota bacterium]
MSKNVSGLHVARLNEELFALQHRKIFQNDLPFFLSFEVFLEQHRLLKHWKDLVVSSSGETFKIDRDIAKLIPTVEEGGLFGRRDPLIENYFDGHFFKNEEPSTTGLHLVRKQTRKEDIIEEARRRRIYKEYEIGPALLLAFEMVKNEVVEGYNTTNGIFIRNGLTDNKYLRLSRNIKEGRCIDLVPIPDVFKEGDALALCVP